MKWSSFILIMVCTVTPVSAQGDRCFSLDARREGFLLGAGFSLSAVGTYFTSQLDPPDPSRLHTDGIVFWDRFTVNCRNEKTAHVSDATLITTMGLPLLSVFSAGSGEKLREGLLLTVESFLLTYGLTQITKAVFRRARPYAYHPMRLPLDGDASQSFFSGHTSIAFASAVVAGLLFQEYHDDSGWVAPFWFSGLTLAAATGICRITSGRHFPTDVIVGALAGSAVGFLIVRAHREILR